MTAAYLAVKNSFTLIFVKYEDLKADFIKELIRISEFLGYTLPENIQICLRRNQEGLFHRKKSEVDQKKYFDKKKTRRLNVVKNKIYRKLFFQ